MVDFYDDFEVLLPRIERLTVFLYGQAHPGNGLELADVVRALPDPGCGGGSYNFDYSLLPLEIRGQDRSVISDNGI
jgi:hypothetical protein